MMNYIIKLIENSGKKLIEISEVINIVYFIFFGYN